MTTRKKPQTELAELVHQLARMAGLDPNDERKLMALRIRGIAKDDSEAQLLMAHCHGWSSLDPATAKRISKAKQKAAQQEVARRCEQQIAARVRTGTFLTRNADAKPRKH